MVEKVLFLSPRNVVGAKLEGWDRIYIGAEFCERLIPSEGDIKNVLDKKEPSISMSLVTPYVTDNGLNKVMNLAKKFIGCERHFDEVIVNDWGLLRVLRSFGPRLVLGRLLVRQLRDPRILAWKKKTPKRLAVVDELSVNEYFLEFLAKENIGRIELDTVPNDMGFLRNRLHISLYTPYTYITTTRLCPVADLPTRQRFVLYVPRSCSYDCIGRIYALKDDAMGQPLYLFGNTIFFRNEETEQITEFDGIDRIVHQELP